MRLLLAKFQLAVWALQYISCRQNYKPNSNFIPGTVASLIGPGVWPLCRRGMAGSMDGLDPPLAPNGCRMRRSAVDTVGVATAQTQEAWGCGCITGVILMNLTAAFPSVSAGCLLRKMRATGINECQVDWTDSFIGDRRVIRAPMARAMTLGW